MEMNVGNCQLQNAIQKGNDIEEINYLVCFFFFETQIQVSYRPQCKVPMNTEQVSNLANST